jgi:large subunit ribosomal protein L43
VNGREKVVPVSNLGHGGVASKVALLADASGRKIVPLKRRTVVSATESPRGMWSQLHADPTVL